MTSIPLTVDSNPWLACSLAMTFLLAAPGLGWGWLGWPTAKTESGPLRRGAAAIALVAIVSTGVSLLVALALGEFGLLQRPLHYGVVAFVALTGLGLGLGIRRRRDAVRDLLRHAAPGTCLMVLAFATVMNLPRQGEWVLGGWDPGVYLNQGVAAARTGSFYGKPLACYTELSPEAFTFFVRTKHKYVEVMPGVAVNPRDRSVVTYFFRLFPTLIAVTAQAGGLRAATRVNEFAGVLTLLAAAALLARAGPVAWSPLFVALLIAQPLWIYHLHTPTSEMLHLYLVLSAAWLWTLRRSHPGWNAAFSGALFLGILNRFDHAVFALLWIAMTAALDLEREDRRRVLVERSVQIAAVLAGVGADVMFSAATLLRLRSTLPILAAAAGGLALAIALIDGSALAPQLRRRARWASIAVARLLALAVVGVVLALWMVHWHGALVAVSRNLRHLMPYVGGWSLGTALAGGLWLAWSRDRAAVVGLGGCALFLCGCATALLIESHIAQIYPWAARRALPFAVPAIALLSSYAVARLWTAHGRGVFVRRAAAALVLVAILWSQRVNAVHAWRNTEYDGMSARLAQVAARIADDDIVLADHPWWGTPLLLLHGKEVISGAAFWNHPDEARQRLGLDALAGLAAAGHRIRLLTSTDKALGVYPFTFDKATLDWESPAIAYREIVHHAGANGFALRDNERRFRLYTWRPSAREQRTPTE